MRQSKNRIKYSLMLILIKIIINHKIQVWGTPFLEF